MLHQLIPLVEREVGVHRGEAGYKVRLERADGSLGVVAAVESSGCKLKIDFLFMHVFFEHF